MHFPFFTHDPSNNWMIFHLNLNLVIKLDILSQIANEDDTDEDGDDDEKMIVDDNSSKMNLDISTSDSNMNSVNRPVNEPLPKVSGEADDGWVVVSNKRNKGRKNQIKSI